MKKTLLCCLVLLYSISAYPWGSDVFVQAQPTGRSSLVATSSGTLYCSSSRGASGVGGMDILESTDMGLSWTPIINLGSGQWIEKSKLVVTGTDSVYCAYQIGPDLFFFSVQSFVTTPFTTVSISDFDIAASANGNAIYLYTDEFTTNNINRYSSTDGGYTWTGSTALVTGNGAVPRICMTGTRLILNYYGPVLNDTATSIIRSAIYNETTPGTLTASTFIDMVAAGPVRSQYASVIINGLVWFVYSEGDVSPVLKYMLSTDNGATYGAETVVPALASNTTKCFDIAPFMSAIDAGMMLVCYTEGLPPQAEMMFTSVTTLAPTSFASLEVINDFNPQCTDASTLPTVFSLGGDAGVIWVEIATGGSDLYFDLRSGVVSVSEIGNESEMSVYPNPVQNNLTIQIDDKHTFQEGKIMDGSGRIIREIQLESEKTSIDISDLSSGIYWIRTVEGKPVRFTKL
ncbi:MAG: T9SS type A sorting domain-containing protein [Bacteroidetes bacterium]|nr:T9SS type A sorting domain-containing protein [Bacteroidota bacterium]